MAQDRLKMFVFLCHKTLLLSNPPKQRQNTSETLALIKIANILFIVTAQGSTATVIWEILAPLADGILG